MEEPGVAGWCSAASSLPPSTLLQRMLQFPCAESAGTTATYHVSSRKAVPPHQLQSKALAEGTGMKSRASPNAAVPRVLTWGI